MPITDISVTDIDTFADGHEFGTVGAYVRIKGVARGMLDPAASENAGIVDLDQAVNAKGLVEYATDFDILRPKDPLRGSSILVYDVPNRGSKRIFNLLDDIPANDPARTNDPRTKEDAGLGFLLGRGYSLVWSGWDPGAPRANNGLGAEFPAALENGKPIVRRIRDEFHFGTRAAGDGSIRRLSYPAASTDQPSARLTVRSREGDRRKYTTNRQRAISAKGKPTQCSLHALPQGCRRGRRSRRGAQRFRNPGVEFWRRSTQRACVTNCGKETAFSVA
jgi:hypothetical protein